MKREKPYRSDQYTTEDLLELLAAGQTDALDAIFDRYYRRLVYYGLQFTNGRDLPEVKDIVQEMFIWIAKNYNRLGSIQHFEAYLFQSVRRNVRAKLQRQQKDQDKFDRYQSRSVALEQGFQHSIEVQIIDNESEQYLQKQLKKALDELPPYQWEVLYLRYYEGRSYKQIANILSIGVQVARNFASRGIKRMRVKMKGLNLPALIFFHLLN